MRGTISALVGFAVAALLSMAVAAAWAPAALAKGPPPCSAIHFHALSSGGGSDGEQTAGAYKSRHARIELRAQVKGGVPVDYYVVANGKRVAAAPPPLPGAIDSCAVAKKLPPPQTPSEACSGERFTLLVDHEDTRRFALLYGLDGGHWRYCNAGLF
jgi:hypothetical protein